MLVLHRIMNVSLSTSSKDVKGPVVLEFSVIDHARLLRYSSLPFCYGSLFLNLV